MGHPIINKGNKGVTLKDIQFSSYKRLLVLAATISAKMGAAVATFATPAPALADLDTAAATLATSAQRMGLRRNRSSKAETLQAQADANIVRYLLQQLMTYSVNTVLDLFPEDPTAFNATLATAGFSMKLPKTVKHISQPRFVTQSNTKDFPAAMMRINWRRGTNLIKNAPIAGYLIKEITAWHVIRTHGYQDILFSAFAPTDVAGLVPVDTYEFKVAIDGNAPQTVSFKGNLAPFMADIVTNINSQLVGATCVALDATNNHFRIQSDSVGAGSSISISGTSGLYLWSNITGYIAEQVPVNGVDETIAAGESVIGTTTKTNIILNPTMVSRENITGVIVPFNALGEGNPINFTAMYIK